MNFIIEKASHVVESVDVADVFVFTIQSAFNPLLQANIADDTEVAPDHIRAGLRINIGFLDVPRFPARENYPVLAGYALLGVPLITGFQVEIAVIRMNLGEKPLPGTLRASDIYMPVAIQFCIFLRAVTEAIVFVIPFKLTYNSGPCRGLMQKEHKAELIQFLK
jgi:hypothetical protein